MKKIVEGGQDLGACAPWPQRRTATDNHTLKITLYGHTRLALILTRHSGAQYVITAAFSASSPDFTPQSVNNTACRWTESTAEVIAHCSSNDLGCQQQAVAAFYTVGQH